MHYFLARMLRLEGMSISLALLFAIAIFGFLSPAFLSAENLSVIAVQSIFILITAVGMTFVLTAGVIDLSIGSVLGLSAGTTMLLLTTGHDTVLAVLAGLGVGVLCGLVNGLLVTVLRLSDFIVTLAMMGVAAGLLQIMAYYQPLRGGETAAFLWLAGGAIAGIPFPIILGALLVTGMTFVLHRTSFGRRVRAAGMSPEAANFAGIDVRRVRLLVFVMSGAAAALAGILLASRLSSVQPALGRGYELQAIAAAVLGGTRLAGGRGSVVGAAVAAILLAATSAGLQIISVDPTWYQVVVGSSILVAVAFHGWSGGYVERHIYRANNAAKPSARPDRAVSAGAE